MYRPTLTHTCACTHTGVSTTSYPFLMRVSQATMSVEWGTSIMNTIPVPAAREGESTEDVYSSVCLCAFRKRHRRRVNILNEWTPMKSTVPQSPFGQSSSFLIQLHMDGAATSLNGHSVICPSNSVEALPVGTAATNSTTVLSTSASRK